MRRELGTFSGQLEKTALGGMKERSYRVEAPITITSVILAGAMVTRMIALVLCRMVCLLLATGRLTSGGNGRVAEICGN